LKLHACCFERLFLPAIPMASDHQWDTARHHDSAAYHKAKTFIAACVLKNAT
jgi:hypothetical protein